MLVTGIVLVTFLVGMAWLLTRQNRSQEDVVVTRTAVFVALAGMVACTIYFWRTTGRSIDSGWWPVGAVFGSVTWLSVVVTITWIIRSRPSVQAGGGLQGSTNHEFQEHLERLRALPHEKLRSLPEAGEEMEFKRGWRTMSHIVWHFVDDNGVHLFGVAEYDKSIGTELADGFALDDSGMRPLTHDELMTFY